MPERGITVLIFKERIMKLNKKKGFTIVELVIVIAIIAILAAVLIPTFASLIRKANESADIQACRQMNTYLAVNEVTGNKDITDVYAALKAGGMTAKDYRPLVSDRYFFWDSKLNRILYTDKDNKVLFPDEYKDVKSKSEDTTNGNQWFSLSGKIDTSKAKVEIPTEAPKKDAPLKLEAANAADLVKIAEYIDKYKTTIDGINITIEITDNMNLNGADICFNGGNDSGNKPNVTINGYGNTITGLYISDNHSGLGYDANGNPNNDYGAAMFGWVNNLTVKDLTIDSAVVGTYEKSQGAIFASHVSGDVNITNVTIKNSTVYGDNKTGLLFGYVTKDNYNVNISNVTVENSNVYSKGGECGLLFGVVTGSSNSQTSLESNTITLSTIKVDANSSAHISPDATLKEVSGMQCVDTGNKYRQATAKFGFYGINQDSKAKKTVGDKTVTNWKPIDEERFTMEKSW